MSFILMRITRNNSDAVYCGIPLLDAVMPLGNTCVIAVHAGAGYHSQEKGKEYRALCAGACKEVMACLKSGATAVEAVTLAVKYLENAPILNAGTGSCLNFDGKVECDASVMDGKTLNFGAVGAVSEIKNPIVVAKKLIDEQKLGSMSLGRIPPCTMVGTGATKWATDHGIPKLNEDILKTDASRKTYKNHKRRLEEAETRRNKKRCRYLNNKDHSDQKLNIHEAGMDKEEDDRKLLQNGVQDTVGAVCIDVQGNVAAGVSSGGISLKQTGRLGPAALYGAGCWATNWQSANKPGIAVATSGTGEYLMKTLLARQCAECLQSDKFPEDAFRHVIEDKFLGSEFLRDIPEKFGGILALRLDALDEDSKICDLLWGHTTVSMCIGFMSHDSKPKTIISRLDEDKVAGQTFVMEGKSFKV